MMLNLHSQGGLTILIVLWSFACCWAFTQQGQYLKFSTKTVLKRRAGDLTNLNASLFNFDFGRKQVKDIEADNRPSTRDIKAQLLKVVEDSQRGLLTTPEDQELINDYIAKLEALNPAAKADPEEYRRTLNKRWRLTWTTEQEVLFIAEKGFFGLPVMDIYQDIDTVNNRLQNMIEFPQDSYFSVMSSCREDQDNTLRVNFEFSSCSAKWKSIKVPLPPFGKGWFENVYLDDDLRINRDSRGDLQITTPY
uniref:Plastid lipid-associated protein/fibrillin conserved domain-containing protein n=1 Tax=Heterosigma akashiwo TaxID=2829 RepID=A0A7S3XXJ7_HETAK